MPSQCLLHLMHISEIVLHRVPALGYSETINAMEGTS